MHIQRAVLNKIFSGNGATAMRLRFDLSDGYIVWADLAPEGELKSDVIELKIFEGAGIGSDFIEASEELATEMKVKNLPKNIKLLIAITAAKATAYVQKKPLYQILSEYAEELPALPVPIINLFSGATWGDTDLDFAEYLILPSRENKASLFTKFNILFNARQELAVVLENSGYDSDVGTLGGFSPDMTSSIKALELMTAAALNAGWTTEDFHLGVNVGAHHLYQPQSGEYLFSLDRHHVSTGGLTQLFTEWLNKYNVYYLEDGLDADDVVGWREASDELRHKIILAGKYLFAGSKEKFRTALKDRMANTVVAQSTQFNALSEFLDFIKLVKKHNYSLVINANYPETEDTWLADLAVAWGMDFVKFGSLARAECTAKYNRLVEIEREMVENI